ncbi:FxLYD domain-containing protein [Bacillus litorisediminis]|uniref:FxLYD domain-containing protein n=1 Tax=Bacillus litorisediminis TaxID=2922713 RepID=UPI001FAF5FDE|nr:FxLYD domain-containing protein [Bacillus litorisediminis]
MKITFILFFISLVLGACSPAAKLDDSIMEEIEEKLTEQFSTYFLSSIVEESLKDPFEYNGSTVYYYNVISYTNSTFTTKSDDEKVKIMYEINELLMEYTEDGLLIQCGKKIYCSFDQIVLSDNSPENNYFQVAFNTYSDISDMTVKAPGGEYISAKNEEQGKDVTTTNSKPMLEIVDSKAEISGDFIYVEGAVVNNSESSFSYIQVEVTYYDNNGNMLDSDWTYVNGDDLLSPNERKAFTVMTEMVGQKYEKFKVEILDFNY